MNARILCCALLLLTACESGPNVSTRGTGASDDPRGYVDRLGIATWTHSSGIVWVLATEVPGPAAGGGVEPSDAILSVDDQKVKSPEDINQMLKGRAAGDRVTLELGRWNSKVAVQVTLERSGPKAMFGAHFKTGTSGKGLAIETLVADSPAGRAGLTVGDRVLRIGNDPVHSYADMMQILAVHAPGDAVPVEVERGGSPQNVTVTLGQRPAPQLALLPGWNGSKEAGSLSTLNRLKGTGKFGVTPGTEYWVKSVFLPSADPEEIGRRWINYLVPKNLVSGLLSPERLGPGELPEGSHSIDPVLFDKPASAYWTFMLAGKAYYGIADFIYRGHLYATGEHSKSMEEYRRELVLQIYTDKPGRGSIPYRVLFLAHEKACLGNDPWQPAASVAFYAERRLWSPKWEMTGNRVTKMELIERSVPAGELFKLRPFDNVPVEDVTNFLIAWKSTELEKVLRDARTEELRDHAIRIEQAILEANEAAEKEKDEAQRRVERNQDGVEACTRRSRTYRSRIEVLKPILAGVKEEIANRGK